MPRKTSLIKPSKRGGNIELLSCQQQMFVHEVLATKNFDTTMAAKNAGYAQPAQAAVKLLKHDKIKAILGRAMKDRMDRLELTQDKTIVELMKIGFANPQQYYDEEGHTIPVHQLDPLAAAAIQDIDEIVKERFNKEGDLIGKTTTYRYKLHSKISAIDMLGKHQGMWKDAPINLSLNSEVVNNIMAVIQQVEEHENVVDGRVIEQAVKEKQ